VYGKKPEKAGIIAAFMILCGSVVAGADSFTTDATGFAFVWFYNISQSLFDVVTEKLNKDKKITPFEINLSFCLLSIILTSFWTIFISGEISLIRKTLYSDNGQINSNFVIYMLFNCFGGIMYTVSRLLAVSIGGAIACNITGVLKDVFLTYIGFIAFNTKAPSDQVLVGLAFSFGGAIFYTGCKIKASLEDRDKKTN
jgi:hypothetical protein